MTEIEHKINNAIGKAGDFLSFAQNSDGSFYSAPTNQTANNQCYKTVFYQSLILYCLSASENQQFTDIKASLCKLLQNQKSGNCTYNYWLKDFKSKIDEVYPDDLDDTACSLSALLSIKKNCLSQADLAALTKALISAEKKPGGPYQTWILPKTKEQKWKDIDLAVNANVGFVLSLLDINLPNIDKLIDSAITANEYSSPYYYSKNAVFYFISRFYQGPLKEELKKEIVAENSKPFRNPLECILSGLALLNLGASTASLKHNTAYLLSKQIETGSFGLFPFVVERASGSAKRISGSEAFTTALAIEFLTKYLKQARKNKPKKIKSDDRELLRAEVLAIARKRFKKRFDQQMANEFEKILQKIVAYDKDYEICLHPFLFNDALISPREKVKKKDLLNLCVGSIFGWIAYTIYDNIMDEKKDIDKISLANICLRELQLLYCDSNRDFEKIFLKFMDEVDQQNFSEYKNARFPVDALPQLPSENFFADLEIVAKKSIAHALSPLSVMSRLDYQPNSRQFKNVEIFYRKYLTARQLNDDAHDWLEDLSLGQINIVGDRVLRTFYMENHRRPCLKSDKTALQKIFWHKIILEISNTIIAEVSEARNCLVKAGSIDINYLSEKLNELEIAAKTALSERNKTLSYLNKLFE